MRSLQKHQPEMYAGLRSIGESLGTKCEAGDTVIGKKDRDQDIRAIIAELKRRGWQVGS